MSNLNEHQSRRSETALMVGRLNRLTCDRALTSDQRIGAIYALQILEARRLELDTRPVTIPDPGDTIKGDDI